MHHKNPLRRKELAAAISLMLATSTAVYAQDVDEDAEDQATENEQTEDQADLGTVYVTGIRAGLQTSLDIKRNESSIVEAVSAEEIGKLPDLSITDSLARLPGVTAQRLNGRSQVISVRGLGPDFTTALLNGRLQVSTGDNRGVEFDAYPSELIQAAVVYKTPDAGLMGQGLAGTVDLRTIRPLEYGERAMVANARYEWNDIDALNSDADDSGWRGSFSYVDQFADDTIGVALGVAYLDSPTQSERFNAWGYPSDPGAAIIGGAKPYAQSNNLERTGVMGVLEFRPTDTLNITLDGYYTDFQETQLLRGIEIPLWWSSAVLEPGFTVEEGLITAGTFSNVKGVMRNDLNTRDAELYSIGGNFEWTATDNLKVILDLSYSKTDREDVILETYSGTGPAGEGATDTLGFQMRDGQGALFFPTLDYTDPNLIMLTSPQGWGGNIIPGGQLGYFNQPVVDDEINWIDVRGEYVFDDGFFSSLEFGVNYNERDKSKVNNEFFLSLADGSFSAPLPQPTGITDLSFLGIPGMITYDPVAAINSGIYALSPNPVADVVVKAWTVNEEVTTPFIMANFDTLWGNTIVSGNVGFQYVMTDQSSTADAASGNSGTDLVTVLNTGGAEYEEFLPSMNVTFQFANDNFIRFAYGRTLARPRMDDLRASLSWGYNEMNADETDINNSPWSGGGGNPELRPWIADAFDLSWEKYFLDGLSYVAVAAFYKDLDSWVINLPQVFDFSGYPIGDGPEPVLREGLINIPQNGTGGDISGFELAAAINMGAFTDSWWGGFGIAGSASFTDSSVEDSPGNEISIPGLSEDVYNLTVYYETDRFSIRANGRKRSDFLGEVSGFGNGRDFRTVEGETVVDAQASYFFGGSLEGFSILGQVLNLTDEEFTTFSNNDTRQIIDFQRYGRTYLLGVSYTF